MSCRSVIGLLTRRALKSVVLRHPSRVSVLLSMVLVWNSSIGRHIALKVTTKLPNQSGGHDYWLGSKPSTCLYLAVGVSQGS